MKIGVLAVQGNFREHAAMLRRLGADVVEVRKPAELEGLDGLVIPGGESTAIGRLIRLYGLEEAKSLAALIYSLTARLARAIDEGEPVLLRQGRLIVSSFHPELTNDTRVHERFLDLVREEARVRA